MGLLSGIFNPATGHGSDGSPPTVTPNASVSPAPPPPQNTGTPAPPPPGPTPAPAPGSSLDSFKDLWETPKNDKGEPIKYVDPLSQPIFEVDPAKLTEAASKLDFMANIPAESIQKALGGDQQAFASVLNTAVRNAVVGISASQGNLVKSAIEQNNARLTQALPTHVKRVQLDQQTADNPILEHPSVAPLITALKQAEFAKNPNASPEEVHKKVTNYVLGIGTALQENQTATATATSGKKEQDWLNWANM